MSFLAIVIGVVLVGQGAGGAPEAALDNQLRGEDPAAIARDGRVSGDPRRGAAVFDQPALTCTKCHESQTGAPSLGPDLAALGKDATDLYLVESILRAFKGDQAGL